MKWTGQEVAFHLRQAVKSYAGTTVHGFPGYAAGEAVPTLQTSVKWGLSLPNTASSDRGYSTRVTDALFRWRPTTVASTYSAKI